MELKKIKEFLPSSWSIDNRTSIYVLTVIITLAGLVSYNSLPKEQFPEIVFPQMYVSTIYPGTSPGDMENLVTKHIEKQVKAITGVKKVTSNSVQDYSSVLVEFNTDVDIAVAKTKVKDAVDKAKNDLPKDLPDDPEVIEIDVSQIPIMNINVAGNYDLDKLKKYAEDLKDRVEALREITRVDLIGAPEREVQINVDKFKMEAAGVTLTDIERAVAGENITISGGAIKMNGVRRNLNISGEFKSVEEINNVVIRSNTGSTIYLKDMLEGKTVKDTWAEKESYARLDGKNVITLNVIKRSGENLIDASDKIRAEIEILKKERFPEGLEITITGDQADTTRVTLHDLINTIIIGFILVVIILMFFMGTTNAIFVGLSVPLSMCVAFLVMPGIGFTLNMIVLFSFLLALGIVVDDAIVVIENTHRIFDNGKVPIKTAAKHATGEVFLPVLSGTMTTLAPFIPLAFWSGVIGKFMYFLPITLIVTLLASLVVAYIMNPVFAVDFMKPHDTHGHKSLTKGNKITILIFGALALIFYLMGFTGNTGMLGMGNLTMTVLGLWLLNKFVLNSAIEKFQNSAWPRFQDGYEKLLAKLMSGRGPIYLVLSTVGMLFFSFWLIGVRTPNIVFFPQSDPNFIYTYISLPVGTDQAYTDSVAKVVEKRIAGVLGDSNYMVESVITNVAVGAGNSQEIDLSVAPHKAKVTVAFVKFSERNGKSTLPYITDIREAVKGIPGTVITVEQEQGGPPTGKPINIEITGDNYEQLISVADDLKAYIDKQGIEGIEELKSDVVKNKPEATIVIDRERANALGIATYQIGGDIRTAVFGKEISKYKENNEEYEIQLRYQENQRYDLGALLNMNIIYRDMNMGGAIRQVPLASIATIKFNDTYGGIKRKNQKRMVTLSSNVLEGANANLIVGAITRSLPQFGAPDGVMIKMTGEQEDQAETGAFLAGAMFTSILLIFLILVAQFNSISKPIIIMLEILFSVIGVLLGFAITKMDMSIIMTGIGIVALAGIVVRNGILLVEFTEVLEKEGMKPWDAAVKAARTRMTPVLMTASATILGLVPLAVGLNIDFVLLFTEFNPNIFFGGDSVAFWGPLSWTMIFGLAFATLLTLFLVPAMYILVDQLKRKIKGNKGAEPQQEEPIKEWI